MKHSLHIILPDDVTFEAWKAYQNDNNVDPDTGKKLSQNHVFINMSVLKPYLPADYKLELKETRGRKKSRN